MQYDDVLATCGRRLIGLEMTIAFAESATAGRAAAAFSLIEDAGRFLKGGIVCYDACLKEDILKVPRSLIRAHTPESAEVTRAITEGLSRLIDADIHIGITGLPRAGGSESAEKPVGTMFIYALCRGKAFFSDRRVFAGTPEEVIVQAIACMGGLLLAALADDHPGSATGQPGSATR